jgi:outer membrane protein
MTPMIANRFPVSLVTGALFALCAGTAFANTTTTVLSSSTTPYASPTVSELVSQASYGSDGSLLTTGTTPVVSDLDLGSMNVSPLTEGTTYALGGLTFTETGAPEGIPDYAELKKLVAGAMQGTSLRINTAVCTSLESNQALRVERLTPEISNTAIEAAEGEFDTTVDGNISAGRDQSPNFTLDRRNEDEDRTRSRSESRDITAGIGIGGRAMTGTNYRLSMDQSRNSTNQVEPFFNSGVNLTLTQNLLRGAGTDVNSVRIKLAQNSFVKSLYQLQQVVINQVTNVQLTYYRIYLARETIRIRFKAYEVAREQRQLIETQLNVGVGTILDVRSAQAEESATVSDLIQALANYRLRTLELIRLMNPSVLRNGWQSQYRPIDIPGIPEKNIKIADRTALARKLRPDIRQAELDLANGELEVVRTYNGLLPQLDAVFQYGLEGIGDSLGESNRDLTKTRYPSWRAGLEFSYPLQNRVANSAYRRANFNMLQAQESIENFRQLIDLEVRSAAVDIDRTFKLIKTTNATRILREEQLRSENEKFRVGRSTQIQVAQAQRDLTQAELDEITALVANIASYLELYRVEGSTLQRFGIQPVMINANSGVE